MKAITDGFQTASEGLRSENKSSVEMLWKSVNKATGNLGLGSNDMSVESKIGVAIVNCIYLFVVVVFLQ